jgi:salicylate hydroxylase
VYEKATTFGEAGAGIQLAPNAGHLLHQLGLADAISAVAVRSAAIEVRSGETGKILARISLEACAERFGAPYYLLTRTDLHAVLASSTPAGSVRLGKACVAMREMTDGVEVRFADGTSVVADIVVGADGIRSRIRRERVRDEPVYSGMSVYRGMVPAERLSPFFSEPRTTLWAGPGKHFVSYPVAAGRLVNFVATVPAAEWHRESWSEAGDVRDVLNAFTDWDDAIRSLVRAADSVTRWALHTRDADTRWSTRRTTLAGDAAHPMLPFMAQGANQGIEDAVALASALVRGGPDALLNYEHARRQRATTVQRMSGDVARLFHQGAGPSVPSGALGMREALDALEGLFEHDVTLVGQHMPRQR